MAGAAANCMVFSYLSEFIQKQGRGSTDEIFLANFISSICRSHWGIFSDKVKSRTSNNIIHHCFIDTVSIIVFALKTEKLYLRL